MIDFDKLSILDSTQEVSDELLAAYIDGNTTEEENLFVEQHIPTEEIDAIMETTEDSQSFQEYISVWDGDYGFWELGLPPVLTHDGEINTLNQMNMERNIYFANAQFGEEAKIDVSGEVFQWYDDTCAIKSQQLVLEQYGIEVSQEDLISIAEEQGWYRSGEGTPMNFVGNLLDYHNIPSTSVVGANVGNLVAELAQGHQVIIGLDSGELHNNSILEGIKDFFLGGTPDHALIVAGIDLTDPNNSYVILKDPGTGDVAKPYPLDQFMDAWNDANCFMVSTNEPTPAFELQHMNLHDINGMSVETFLSENDFHNQEFTACEINYDLDQLLSIWIDTPHEIIDGRVIVDDSTNLDGIIPDDDSLHNLSSLNVFASVDGDKTLIDGSEIEIETEAEFMDSFDSHSDDFDMNI